MTTRARFASIVVLLATVVVVMFLGLVLANMRDRARRSVICPHDKDLRTYEEWRKTVTFPYVAPDAKLRRVKDNYDQVHVDSSKEDVTSAFGAPDFEEELYAKEPAPKWCGYAFMYYFERPEETANEFNDKSIEVFFTRGGKVNWIVGNVGLPERGSPAHRP